MPRAQYNLKNDLRKRYYFYRYKVRCYLLRFNFNFLNSFIADRDRRCRKLNVKEQEFCNKYSIDQSLFSGRRIDYSPVFNNDAFFINGLSQDRISYIKILVKPSLSNAFTKLINAYLVAKLVGIRKIYFPTHEIIDSQFEFDGIKFQSIFNDNELHGGLEGQFFYGKTFKNLEDFNVKNKLVGDFFRYTSIDKGAFKKLEDHSNDFHLYIHIRSGDVFTDECVHPMYGQPPLSYYIKIIESRDWTLVHLVYENEYNPVISSIIAYLEFKRCKYNLHSKSLKEDVEFLLGASNLVCARGTFIFPILCASSNIKNVYYYDLYYNNEYSYGESPYEWGLDGKINFYNVINSSNNIYRDKVLFYWQNTESQRKYMLDADANNLQIHQIMTLSK